MNTFQYGNAAQAKKRKLSLSVRVSLLLVFAVVLPLIITLLGSFFILRPTLITQASTDMENDAASHAQLMDSYFVARLQELGYIGQYAAIQNYLSGDNTYEQQASNELATGYSLDADYMTWALFDLNGNLRLAYPTDPKPRGQYNITPEAKLHLNGTTKTFISDVYFDGATHKAFVDLYTLITDSTNHKPVGYGRATLDLNQIWAAINNETNAGSGTFAVLLDNHNVRIAYTNSDSTGTTLPSQLFKSITPLSADFKQQIQSEDLYGADDPGSLFGYAQDDSKLVNIQQEANGPTSFQITPASMNEPYQVSRSMSHIVSWTYLVLRPVSVITRAADTQTLYLFLLSAVITVLAAFVGLYFGRDLTRPILSSVSSLMDNSQSLRSLADTEQHMAQEQKWIVESSQSGLQSVKYYAEATTVGARKLDELSTDLLHSVERNDLLRVRQRMEEIISTARYVEKAAMNQKKSSAGLGSAISITAQVTEQLLAGATSATEAAAQLDSVVEQLREVAGK